MAVPLADILSDYIDINTKLPRPSWSVTGDKCQTTTYATGITYLALSQAASLAELLSDTNSVIKYRTVADDIRDNAGILWSTAKQYFYRGILRRDNSQILDEQHDVMALLGIIDSDLFSSDIIGQALQAIGYNFDESKQMFAFVANGEPDNINRLLTVELLAKIDNDKSTRILHNMLSGHYSNDIHNTDNNCIDDITFMQLILALAGRQNEPDEVEQ